MNILYTLNDKFLPQVAASITSICENNKKMNTIHFYLIVLGGLSLQDQKKLQKCVKKYNRELDILPLENLANYFDFEFDTNGWNPIVLARLLVDKILPKNIDKVLYLDGDTICRGDLTDLWLDNMDGKVVGASIEPTVDKKRKQALGLENSHYYNAGVLLINLEKWRHQKIGSKIINYYKEHSGKLFANDQDAINGCLKNQIYTLSPKYNYCNIFDQYSYRFLCKLEKPAEYIDKNTFLEAKKNPVIIHYLGEERPWRKHNTHKYRDDYKHYLSLTEWKDTPDEEGWGLYFFCWRIFNLVTYPFNRLRYTIINSLIPVFMNYRSLKLKKAGEK